MMTDELICPFCQRELKTFAKYKDGTSTVYCSKCNLIGDSKLFSELIRTRKALDIAINVLNRVKDVKYEEYIDEKLEQINEIIKGGDNE